MTRGSTQPRKMVCSSWSARPSRAKILMPCLWSSLRTLIIKQKREISIPKMKPSASKSEPWRAKGRFRRRRRNVVEICYLYLILLRICDLIIIYFNPFFPIPYKTTLLKVRSLSAIFYIPWLKNTTHMVYSHEEGAKRGWKVRLRVVQICSMIIL